MSDLEYCDVCEEPTGRAGAGEDSLFLPNGDGPFCEECWNTIRDYAEKRKTRNPFFPDEPAACIRFEYMSDSEKADFQEEWT